MTDSVLKSVMRLFAIIGNLRDTEKSDNSENNYIHTRNITDAYLNQLLNPEQVQRHLQIFDFHYKNLQRKKIINTLKRISLYSVKTLLICEQINEDIEAKQKVYIIIQLLDILNINRDLNYESFEFVRTIAESIGISGSEYNILYMFVFQSFARKRKHESFLVVSNLDKDEKSIHHLTREHLLGTVVFYHHSQTNSYYFRHEFSDDGLSLNGRNILFNRYYIFDKGSVIRCPKIQPIYYTDISSGFLKASLDIKIKLQVRDIEYHFPRSENGIKKFSFSAEAGQIVAIMGGSGVGKSTLLNILNGTLKPKSGKVLLNGYDIYEEPDQIKGIIGFIPQDDFLIEELTVFQNLYFNARLCFSQLSQEEINLKVDKLLQILDLSDTRDLKVGSPLNQLISGGQRKRLNIALELIREPHVLYVDEPTSGLSSSDSENVIEILKKIAFSGKLVFVNIHQPSSDIFKLFDRLLLLDKGGRAIYYGNPIESVVYFKTATQMVNAHESECIWCGNLNPEQVLQIIDHKKINPNGQIISERKVSPEEWYQLFQNNTKNKKRGQIEKITLPVSNFKSPPWYIQFLIFLQRNILTKIADKQYLIVNILEAPLLALIIGYLAKFISGKPGDDNAYVFINNLNFPAYLFMSVVVALFLGMMVSAEEIIKDRKLLKRESFLDLSRFSYINSKIVTVFFISAVQMAIYVTLANFILVINDLNWHFWAVLFTTSCFANILSLNISAALKSVVAIYITIPLLLIPQLLLSGVIVKFDKLHPSLNSETVVPIVGDLMASRWAYEALAVSQFKYNRYERDIYFFEQKESHATYISNYWIPEIVNSLNYCELNYNETSEKENLNNEYLLIKSELLKLAKSLKIPVFNKIDSLSINNSNKPLLASTREYLRKARLRASGMLEIAIEHKNKRIEELTAQMGRENLISLKENNYNNALSDELLNRRETNKIVFRTENGFANNYEPVFRVPERKSGRAHFYAPVKQIGTFQIDTLKFNLMILWLMIFLLYILLLTNGLEKTSRFINQIVNYSKHK